MADQSGHDLVLGVPAGKARLTATCLGMEPSTREIEFKPGAPGIVVQRNQGEGRFIAGLKLDL